MALQELFVGYEDDIKKLFERIVAESGLSAPPATRIELTDTDNGMLFRSIPSERCVKAEWRGVASLWAMSQAVGRLAPIIFETRRNGSPRVEIRDGSPQELGLNFIGYAKELCVRQKWRWNSYFPKPDRTANSDEKRYCEQFFWKSLEWILRHEVAHIALGHQDSPWSADESRSQEREADLYASRGQKGDDLSDAERPAGAHPDESELALERNAVALGIGLVWVALYENAGGPPSEMYPPVADRLYRSLEEFGLQKDSMTSEILSDFIKAWVDPQSAWPDPSSADATAQRALDEACGRLDDYMRGRNQT
ncbi:phage exclusion protein Lit family protein [Bradyrhizobium sp.]|uniref:phage exclusion protein Lit family protein n=1 Tax=Bradyrhizobium sp. TaxID=376 RepID=UPI0025C612FF|nr:phage exclusion protein Lit family protein [Bradyrhizobium sp.]